MGTNFVINEAVPLREKMKWANDQLRKLECVTIMRPSQIQCVLVSVLTIVGAPGTPLTFSGDPET